MEERVAFVAGATGYTGREVVRLAGLAGFVTIAHVRPDSPGRDAWRLRMSAMGAEVDETPWEEASMRETLRRRAPDAIFSLLGTTRKRAKSEGRGAIDAYEAIDYGLSALLRRAAEGSGRRPRFVYLSSLGVTPNTRNTYMKVRARIEAELAAGTIPYTIVRPAVITGADRDDGRPGERIGAVALDGVASILGAFGAKRLGRRLKTTSNTALASELLRVAFDPACERRIVESEELAKT
jgi:uncharacterized protein YbjT (DUF2867 family)